MENNQNNPGGGLAVGSLVMGVVGLLTGSIFGLGCILGIIGVVLAVKSGNASEAAGVKKSGLATAGLILGILSIVFGAGCLLCTVCGAGTGVLASLGF